MAADAYPDAVAVTGFNGHLDGAQHGGVMGVEEGLCRLYR